MTQCSNYLIVVRKSKQEFVCQNKGSWLSAGCSRKHMMSSFLIINTFCMAYLHFICQYFQWFTILTEHRTRQSWIPSSCGAKVTAQLNCSAVKVESCGFAVVKSHNCTFFCLGSSIVFRFGCFPTFASSTVLLSSSVLFDFIWFYFILIYFLTISQFQN